MTGECSSLGSCGSGRGWGSGPRAPLGGSFRSPTTHLLASWGFSPLSAGGLSWGHSSRWGQAQEQGVSRERGGSPDLAVFAPRSKLYTADLESGLHHLLRVELAAHRSLAGAELKTLKDFVTVLAKVHGRLTWGGAPLAAGSQACLGTYVAGTEIPAQVESPCRVLETAPGGGVWSREEGIVRERGSVPSKGLGAV